MSRKIVFINQATGYLTIDIINEFAKEFDEIVLITGSIRIQHISLSEKVKIIRIIRYNRGGTLSKGFSWLIGTFQIIFLLSLRFSDYEKFFFTIPPPAYLFASNLGSRYSIVVFDLFPDAFEVLKIKQLAFLYKWWGKRNKSVFSKAYRIFTLSDRMKNRILEYSKINNIKVISNWTAFTGFKPIERRHNLIIKREGTENKFIVQYSGNIGVTHNIEAIVEVAQLLEDFDDIFFQIIGRGNRSIEIGSIISKRGLRNCKMLPFRSDSELYESLCAADLSIVTLDERTADVSVPSKLYNLMSAGIPVIAITSSNSAISEIISMHKIGRVFEKDDYLGIRDFILQIKNNEGLKAEFVKNSVESSRIYTNANATEYIKSYLA
jgi:glycosyltransferase involved in cell wall biosynthesis